MGFKGDKTLGKKWSHRNIGGFKIKKLLIIISILANAASAWAGGLLIGLSDPAKTQTVEQNGHILVLESKAGDIYDCPDPGTCFKIDKDHPPLHMRDNQAKKELRYLIKTTGLLTIENNRHITSIEDHGKEKHYHDAEPGTHKACREHDCTAVFLKEKSCRWKIKRVWQNYEQNYELEQWLKDGWEPFSVIDIKNSSAYIYWFKRRVCE